MVKLVSAFCIISTLALATASPVRKRQDSTAATITAADTAADTAASSPASTGTDSAATATESASSGAESAASSAAAGNPTASGTAAETTVTAFVPFPGEPVNATLYAVTGANETLLAGLEYVTLTNAEGATSTAAIGNVYVVSEDEVDLYVFDPQGESIGVTECEVEEGGTTSTCNGIIIDIADKAIDIFQNLTITGQSSGVPAYLPTGTADPVGVSFASNAPALVSSVQVDEGDSDTETVAGSQTSVSQASTSPTGTLAEASATDSAGARTDTTAATSTGTEAVPTTA